MGIGWKPITTAFAIKVADRVDGVLSNAENHLEVNRHAQHPGQVKVRDDDQRADENAARLVQRAELEEQDQCGYDRTIESKCMKFKSAIIKLLSTMTFGVFAVSLMR